jgi:sigma-B regulation protein RsbU (phosphoserine phosphatase)
MRFFFTRNILLVWLGLLAWQVIAQVWVIPGSRWITEALCLAFVLCVFLESRELFRWAEELPVRQRLMGLGQIGGLLLLSGVLVVPLLNGIPSVVDTLDAPPSVGYHVGFGILQAVMIFLISGAAVLLGSLVFYEAGMGRKIWSGLPCAALLVSSWALPADQGWVWLFLLALVPSLVTPWTEGLSGRLKTIVFFLGFLGMFLVALYQARITWGGVEQYLLPILQVEMGRLPAGILRSVLMLLLAHALVFQIKVIFSPVTRVAGVRGGLRTKLFLFYLFAGAIPLILMVLILSIGFYIVLGGYRASLAKKLAAEYAGTCLQWSEEISQDPTILRWARMVDVGTDEVTEDPEISKFLSSMVSQEGVGEGVGYVLVQVQVDSSRIIARSPGIPDRRETGYVIPDWALGVSRSGLVPELAGVWGRGITGRDLRDRLLSVEVGVPLDQAFLERMRDLTGVDFELNNGYWLAMSVAGGQVTASRGEVPDSVVVHPEWRSVSTMDPGAEAKQGLLDRRLYFGGAFLPEIDWTTGEPIEKIAGMLLIRTSIRNLYQVLFAPENTINMLLLIVVGILGLLFLVIILVASSVGVRVVQNITGSVGALKKGTQRVRAGDFDYRIRVTSRDEFEDLADSFNVMSAEVRRMLVAVQEKEKLEAELRIARDIQKRLLPQEQPRLAGYEVLGSSRSAREVGGDYFDFLSFDDGPLGIAVGDVSGKGMTAALLMANLQAGLRAFASDPSQISGVMEKLNIQLLRTTSAEMYATFFYGILDQKSGVFSFSNAGHNPPVLIRADGSTELLEAGGLPLGMMEGFPYEEGRAELAPGDVLVLYTDGVTEAENAGGDQLGDDRFRDVSVSSRAESVEAIQERIHRLVKDFAAGHVQSDDLTLVIVKNTS